MRTEYKNYRQGPATQKVRIIKMILLVLLLAFAGYYSWKIWTSDYVRKQILWNKANSAYSKNNLQRSIEMYKKIIEIAPEDESIYFNLGVAYLDVKNIKGAHQQIDKLQRLGKYEMADELEMRLNQSIAYSPENVH